MAYLTHASSQEDRIADRWVRYEDDWSGISDTKERRKVQNRRNQRILRSRRRRELGHGGSAGAEGQRRAPAPGISNSQAYWGYEDPSIRAVTVAIEKLDIPNAGPEHDRTILQRFEAFAQQLYITHSPQLTILPILSQFNFIRALLANMDTLGISSTEMGYNNLSPFNLRNYNRHITSTRLPDGLRLTDLQCTTLHHPWIDLLPFPEMRDNLFRRGLERFNEEELCQAVRGRIPDSDPGMLIWGESWDPNSWEVKESFARSWGWTITGCWSLLRSTNEWRARRGEKPLFSLPR
ncbi:hypothetical protein NCS52_00157700 [Fusarium sp. LHS14.1]|nr:hypothetical protein NCS52_00157700 [Fusarium sp. LHS14.1]